MHRPGGQRRGEGEALGAIEHIFRFMEQRELVEVFVAQTPHLRFQGVIRGFDEWMNFVLDQAVEVDARRGTRRELGRVLLKGDAVSLLHLLRP